MAGRNQERERIEISKVPRDMVAAVIIAQMIQAKTDAETHQDRDAGERIITAVNLVLDLLNGYTTPAVVAAIPNIQAILAANINET